MEARNRRNVFERNLWSLDVIRKRCWGETYQDTRSSNGRTRFWESYFHPERIGLGSEFQEPFSSEPFSPQTSFFHTSLTDSVKKQPVYKSVLSTMTYHTYFNENLSAFCWSSAASGVTHALTKPFAQTKHACWIFQNDAVLQLLFGVRRMRWGAS